MGSDTFFIWLIGDTIAAAGVLVDLSKSGTGVFATKSSVCTGHLEESRIVARVSHGSMF